MDSDDENFQRLVDEEFEELVAAVQDEADEEEAALAAAAAIPRPRYRRRFINRDHVGADQRLMEDYFGDNPPLYAGDFSSAIQNVATTLHPHCGLFVSAIQVLHLAE